LITDNDIQYIKKAIDRARLSTQENGPIRPKVGAVLVLDDKELGNAFRGEMSPGDHAEYGLLEGKLRLENLTNGTLYTTLEPCTVRSESKIPCADRIISRNLRRVVVGMLDPNQAICGRGIRHLQSRRIEVDLFPSDFVLQVEEQNRDFVHYQNRQSQSAQDQPKINSMAAINPRFEDDSARLDGRSFKIENIANRQTIFIISGDTIVSELLDRYTCGLLREKIDIAGKGDPFKRAIIVSAAAWKREHWFTQSSPGISIGSQGANDVSKDWLEIANGKGIAPFPLDSGQGIYLSEPRPRVVLQGVLAADTRLATERYISEPRGLKEFLANAWR
jgi:pyrimidine deaminase RibD-like protein